MNPASLEDLISRRSADAERAIQALRAVPCKKPQFHLERLICYCRPSAIPVVPSDSSKPTDTPMGDWQRIDVRLPPQSIEVVERYTSSENPHLRTLALQLLTIVRDQNQDPEANGSNGSR